MNYFQNLIFRCLDFLKFLMENKKINDLNFQHYLRQVTRILSLALDSYKNDTKNSGLRDFEKIDNRFRFSKSRASSFKLADIIKEFRSQLEKIFSQLKNFNLQDVTTQSPKEIKVEQSLGINFTLQSGLANLYSSFWEKENQVARDANNANGTFANTGLSTDNSNDTSLEKVLRPNSVFTQMD